MITKEQLAQFKGLVSSIGDGAIGPSPEEQALLEEVQDLLENMIAPGKMRRKWIPADESEAKLTQNFLLGQTVGARTVAETILNAAGEAWAADRLDRAEFYKAAAKIAKGVEAKIDKARIDHYFEFVADFDPPEVVEEKKRVAGRNE